MLLFLLGWLGSLVYLYTTGNLGVTEFIAGGGIFVLAFAIRWFIQHTVDSWLTIALSQSSYAHDDAFSSLFERSPVAYLIINTGGDILENNPASIKLLGVEAGTITHANFFTFVQPSEEIDASLLQSKVQSGITLNELEVPLRAVSGKTIWVLLSTFAYRSSGQRLISLVDVTEQKNIDTAKSEFVALATHQLRTPIAAIRWNAELLHKSLKEVATEAQERYLGKVEHNVVRMIALINDFLSVSKLEMGTYAASEEEVNLSDYFSSIVDEFAGDIAKKKIDLQRTEVPPQAVVRTDSRLFHITVSNLVSNAVKYLNPEGRLEFSYQLSGDMLTIVVADNGIGIPEEEIEKLFTKFYRASNAQAHRAEGTGLGLYIVKQSVEQMGGHISVQSGLNKGARFEIVLPVKVVSVQ